MKTKKPFAWNILFLSLGCFLLITNSSRGMFGEEFDQAKADEAARLKAQQQAEQQQRQRELADPDNQQANGSSVVARGDLNGNGPSERPPEELQDDESIPIIIGSYFPSLSREEKSRLINEIDEALLIQVRGYRDCNRPFTEEDKIFTVTRTIARKAGVPPPATVADAIAAYQERVSSLTEAELADFPVLAARLKEEDLSSRVVSLAPAAVALSLAQTTALPHEQDESQQSIERKVVFVSRQPHDSLPPQESLFERKKKETLRNLRDQIATAQRELAPHQATRDRLQRESQQQLQQQTQQQKQNVTRFQKQIDDFKAANFFASRVPGTDEYYQLQALRAKRDSAPSATTQSVNETRVALDATTKSIETLTSHIQSLEQQHAQVTASIDPAIERQLQQANQQSSKGSSSNGSASLKESSLQSSTPLGNDLKDQHAAALAQLAKEIDYKNEAAQELRAAEEAHSNASIFDLNEREKRHKIARKAKIKLSEFQTYIRLKQANAAYLGGLSRSFLFPKEQHEKYSQFQAAVEKARGCFSFSYFREELVGLGLSRENFVTSKKWEEYDGEQRRRDNEAKIKATQSEQLVIKLLRGLPAADASSQISSSSSAVTELEQLQEAVRAAKEERDRVEKIYDQEQEEHAHAWYQQCPPEEYEGWKRWLAKYGLAPYQGGKYKQAYERARDRHAALAQQFYDAQQRVTPSPKRAVAWLELQADHAREAILKAELRGENPQAAHDRYTALTQQLHATRQNTDAFPISALGWYQEQVDLAIRLIGEAEQRVLSPISLSLLWNHYFAMAEQRSLAKPQAILATPHVSSEQERSALRSFQEQLVAVQNALAPHQATKNRLQQQFAEHDQKVSGLQQQVDNFKRGKLFYNFSAELTELRSRRDAATLARTRFVATTRAQIDFANREIATLEHRVLELTTKCEQLTRAVTLSPEQRAAQAEAENFKSPALQQHLRNYLEVIKRLDLDNKINWARTKVISFYGLRGKIFTMGEYRTKMDSLERPIKAKIEQAEAAVDQDAMARSSKTIQYQKLARCSRRASCYCSTTRRA